MKTDIAVRVAGEADLDSLVRLAVSFRDHLRRTTPSDASFRESFAALLEDPATDFLLARGRAGDVLGYAQLRYRHSAWNAASDAEIEDLFVIADERRRGVGRRLLEEAIARARERGCRVVGLNTNERNEAALALYRRLGFASERAHWSGGRQLWIERSLDDE
jgi:ribosomal protein S18 acetylase RimI-like enzyme